MVKLGALCALLGMVGASFAEPLNAAIERRVRVRYTSCLQIFTPRKKES
jgi:hypothetical protein